MSRLLEGKDCVVGKFEICTVVEKVPVGFFVTGEGLTSFPSKFSSYASTEL